MEKLLHLPRPEPKKMIPPFWAVSLYSHKNLRIARSLPSSHHLRYMLAALMSQPQKSDSECGINAGTVSFEYHPQITLLFFEVFVKFFFGSGGNNLVAIAA